MDLLRAQQWWVEKDSNLLPPQYTDESSNHYTMFHFLSSILLQNNKKIEGGLCRIFSLGQKVNLTSQNFVELFRSVRGDWKSH